MTRRWVAGAFAVGLGLSLADPAAAADLRIATEGAYPPWNSVDSSGQLIGFELDLARNLCERMQVECEIVVQDWDGIIPGLLAGRYDAIMAGMSITDERRQSIAFSHAYANTPIAFAALKGSDLESLDVGTDKINFAEPSPELDAAVAKMKEAFDGLTIGAQVSTTHQNLVQEYFGDVAEIRTYDTMDNMALDLGSARIDAGISELDFIRSVMDNNPDVVVVGPNMSGGPLGEGVAAGLRKDDTELVEKFNAAIEAAKADGTIKTLGEQWFRGIDVTPQS
ncbi:transporter substrate-binding domain-containing protein [Marinivivus vitaminiproducens]|uniref:transporter substrate-binding domain-containing protein n=1 Tax=Marinivivus vitaminiproducens TaxID=3035935 RepID=UPI00279C78D7|nr:transporter substrate-binding domain-containing protein [Geminicoccaceae bacterium SCSIO 64248]